MSNGQNASEFGSGFGVMNIWVEGEETFSERLSATS